MSRPTVSLWRKRYAEHGIAGLRNEVKPGRPRSTGEDEIATLINTALTRSPSGKTYWSRRSLAKETGLSKSAAHHCLTLFGLQPTQNAFVESFNGKFRDECLNEHGFGSLAEARAIVAAWRVDYNERRPHSALGYRTPAEYAAEWRARQRDGDERSSEVLR